ncbi:aspartate dehydrogenase, partial [Dietzia sp. E1]|nr:aspartate dehydrogenase [Dietzia sp. E1]
MAVVGAGAIGGAVIEALEQGRVPGAELGAVLRSGSSESETAAAIDAADVVVEASTVDAADDLIPRVTATGTDVVVCSCGVFARHDDPWDL